MTVESLQTLCKKFPQVTEDVKWGQDLCFCVAKKMFLVVGLGESPSGASFKVTDEEFDEMCDRDGFKPAPYVAKYKWVWIDDISKMKKADWKKYIKQSYELVKTKLPNKIKKQLGIE